MSKGVFHVAREVFDHPIFKDEPKTEREAWLWMLAEARWKKGRIKSPKGMIEVERAQFSHSIRFMADKWKWSKSRVQRFLNRLETDTMIGTANEAGQLVITICNYEKYQDYGTARGTDSGTPSGTAAGQQRDKEETLEPIKPNNFKKHAFEGKVIKLNAEDLERWRRSYRHIPSLESELQRLDDYYAGINGGNVGNWFVRASAALAKKNQEYATKSTKEENIAPQISRRESQILQYINYSIPPSGGLPTDEEIAAVRAKFPADIRTERAEG